MKGDKKLYLDYLRAFAILAVVIVHAISRSIRPMESGELAYRLGRALIVAGQWAVPIFVMISGSLFLSPDRDIPISKVFKTYIPRIIGAYLFWSCLYTLVFSTLPHYDLLSFAALWNTLTGTLKGGSAHFWFIWLTLGLYLLTPILRICIKNASANLMRYWLCISFFFLSCMPLARNISSIDSILGSNMDILSSAFIGEYVLYFVLGYYLDHVTLTRKSRCVLYIFGIIGALAACGTAFWFSSERNGFAAALWQNLSPCVVFSSIALFIAVKHHSPSKIPRILALITKYSFGIYLSHNLFLDYFGLRMIALLTPQVPSLLIAALLTFCTLVFSIALIALVRLIKPISKYIS